MDIHDILKEIPDKRQDKNTTSLKFKEDVYNLFKDIGHEYTCLEVGTNYGYTTRILSFIFKHVVTIDWKDDPNLRMARELNHDRDNITYIEADVYHSSWKDLNLPIFQVSFIDCGHDYSSVISDINNCIRYGSDSQYMIFDDYGLPDAEVKPAINYQLNNLPGLKKIANIGEPKGNEPRIGKPLIASEGVICLYER
jgi:hypothetical protein